MLLFLNKVFRRGNDNTIILIKLSFMESTQAAAADVALQLVDVDDEGLGYLRLIE